MKAALAVLGVLVFGGAVYFIARGKGLPMANGGQKTPPKPSTPTTKQVVAQQLLTSANVAALGGLLTSILPGGGSAQAASMPGNGTGLITSYN